MTTTTKTPKVTPDRSFAPVPGCKLVLLADLKPGDVFQYQGGDLTNWNQVSKIDDEKFYYPVRNGNIMESNWRHHGSIYVWVKEVQA